MLYQCTCGRSDGDENEGGKIGVRFLEEEWGLPGLVCVDDFVLCDESESEEGIGV